MLVVDLEKAVAVLDGMKSEAIYRAVSGPVRPGGRDADVLVVSWLVGWLSRSFTMRPVLTCSPSE
jgi:hypothetical protein